MRFKLEPAVSQAICPAINEIVGDVLSIRRLSKERELSPGLIRRQINRTERNPV